MRKLICFALVAAFILGVASVGIAQEHQVIKVKVGDVIDHLAFDTTWGNVYFNDRDVKKLTHAMAKLQPIYMGEFTTDKKSLVKVKALGYKAGVATLQIIPLN